VIPDPLHLAASWVAGTAGASAALAWASVGSSGLRLLLAAVVGAGAAGMALTGAGGEALVVSSGLAWVVATLRLPRRGSVGWLAATAGGVLAAGEDWLALVGDATLLGSITVGLCLGHWFLVDPHLPRGPMRVLAWSALAGLAVVAVATATSATPSSGGGRAAVPIAVVAGVVSALSLAAVPLSLAVPTYKGVQSATGLFYVSTMSVGAFVIVASAIRAG
jgi:hypothetical protein